MFKPISLLSWSSALLAALAVQADPVIDQLGEPVERHLSDERPLTQWSHDPAALETEAGDRLETRAVAGEKLETVKLTGVVPPNGAMRAAEH